jgi:hypothetical protein
MAELDVTIVIPPNIASIAVDPNSAAMAAASAGEAVAAAAQAAASEATAAAAATTATGAEANVAANATAAEAAATTATGAEANVAANATAAEAAAAAALASQNAAATSATQAGSSAAAALASQNAAAASAATASAASTTATTQATNAATAESNAQAANTAAQAAAGSVFANAAPYRFTATAGQTTWSPGGGVTWAPGSASVYVNGSRWNITESYADSTGTSLTFNNPLVGGYQVAVYIAPQLAFAVTGVSTASLALATAGNGANMVGFAGANGKSTTVAALASSATGNGDNLVAHSATQTVAQVIDPANQSAAAAFTGAEQMSVKQNGSFVATTLQGISQFTIGTLQAATIAAMLSVPAAALANSQQISVANYATPYVTTASDGGGGTFAWNATSTATPDGGVTFAPTSSLTAVAGAAMATGNGSTLTFSGTFAHGIINPGSVSVVAGAVTFADDGAGNLLVSGLPSGTINYTTGAWTLKFAAAPSVVITGSYSYAATAGRWLRQFSGNASALWWGVGAKAIAAADATAAIQAANNFAYANSMGFEIPPPPGYASFKTSYTVTLTATYVNALPVAGGGNYPNISFSAASTADLYPAFVVLGAYVRGINVTGTATNNLFTGSLATMSTNGAINPTTLGDLSVYTTVPPYSAFAAGPVGFSLGGGSSQPVFDNCSTGALKFGLVLDSTNGHTSSRGCQWRGGVAGVYVKTNSESYVFKDGGISGGLCKVLLGDTTFVGHNGGIGGGTVFENIDFGFVPYCFLQVHDNPTTITTSSAVYETVFVNCYFESIGEASFRLLPYSSWAPQLINCSQPVNTSATYQLPAAFTLSNGHAQFLIWCGFIGQFKQDSPGNAVWGYSAVSGAPNGVAVCQGIISGASYTSTSVNPLRPQDLSFFGTGLVVVNAAGTVVANPQLSTAYPSFLNPQSRLPEATKNVLAVRRDFAPQANLINNPEIATNWVIGASGNTVAIASYANTAGLPAITAAPLDMLQELGVNPNVVSFNSGTATSLSFNIPFPGNPRVIAHPTNVGMSFWAYAPALVGMRARIQCGNAGVLYDHTYNITSTNGWFKVVAYGQNSYQNSSGATDNYFNFQVFSNTAVPANTALYICGLMVFADEVTAYNPYSGPSADAPIGAGSYVAASLPSAANFPLGAHTFCTNGRNTGEASGAGTGCLVFVKSISGTNTWCAVWSGVAVTT